MDHLYLFDQDGSPEAREILAPFVASGRVTVHNWLKIDRKWDIFYKPSGKTYPFQKNRNHLAYAFAARKYRNDTRWMLKIDVDEFLVAPDSNLSIQAYLQSIDPTAFRALRVPRYDFGDSGLLERPSGGVTENYIRREVNPSNYKDIANTRFLNGNHFCNSSHRWSYRLINRAPIHDLRNSDQPSLRIHHYYTKSREEYFDRQNICGGRIVDPEAYAAIQRRSNAVEDTSIPRLLPPGK